MQVENSQRFRNTTGYMTADNTPAITPAVAPIAQELLIQYAIKMTKVVPPTTATMNIIIRAGLLGRCDMDPTLRLNRLGEVDASSVIRNLVEVVFEVGELAVRRMPVAFAFSAETPVPDRLVGGNWCRPALWCGGLAIA